VHKLEAPAVLSTARPTPLQVVGHVALTLGMLALIAVVLFPMMGNLEDAKDALADVTFVEMTLLLVVFLFNEYMKAMPYVVLVDGMGLPRSFVCNEASATISNTIPGPSGTAAAYLMFRSWGFGADDFGKATIVNGVWNNAVLFLGPSVAFLIYYPGHDVASGWVVIGLVGLVIAAVGGYVVVRMIRSESFSRWVGVLCGRVVTWARGIVRRPRPADFGDAVVRFRGEVIETVRTKWGTLTIVMVVKYLASAALLLMSLRAVGIPASVLDWREVLLAYAAVRVVTMIQITPGGVGITEVAYSAALQTFAGNEWDSAILAGTLVFRGFSYLGPIILGIPCYVVWRSKRSWRRDQVEVRDDPAGFATAGFRRAQ
jgi:uncharacterized membrane protein YbhN (UPF0104 family)